jgi:hypothetical protein
MGAWYMRKANTAFKESMYSLALPELDGSKKVLEGGDTSKLCL